MIGLQALRFPLPPLLPARAVRLLLLLLLTHTMRPLPCPGGKFNLKALMKNALAFEKERKIQQAARELEMEAMDGGGMRAQIYGDVTEHAVKKLEVPFGIILPDSPLRMGWE